MIEIIKIKLNGKEFDCEKGSTILSITKKLKLQEGNIVAEFNGKIIPSEDFDKLEIISGSKLELINFVGGG